MLGKKIKIQIVSWLNGSVLFEYESKDNTIAKTVEKAINENADLRSADLRSANLSYADLRYAKNLLPAFNMDNLSILKNQKNKLIAYKYLDGDQSPTNSKKLTYKVGKVITEKDCNFDEFEQCGAGLNVATIEWCLRETSQDLDRTYIEIEFDPKDIVAIPWGTDGKFRVSKLKVLRKLTKKELEKYLKPINETKEEIK